MRMFAALLAFLVMTFVAQGAMSIPALSGATRCTADAFGRSDGNAAVTPGTGKALKVQDLALSKSGNSASVSFKGVTALLDDDLVNLTNKSAFYVVYRCDENSTAATVWETVSAVDGTTRKDIVAASAVSTIDFTDTFGGAVPDSLYYYIVVAVASASDYRYNATHDNFDFYLDGEPSGVTKTKEEVFKVAYSSFNSGTVDTAPTWSPALAASISFLPTQKLALTETQPTGIVSPVLSADWGSLAFGASLSKTVYVTSEKSEFNNSPQYAFNHSFSRNGAPVTSDSVFSVTASADSFTVAVSQFTDYGSYTLSLGVTASASGVSPVSTATVYSVMVNPPALDIDKLADASVATVEIGKSSVFSLARTTGLISGSNPVASTVAWTITENSALEFSELSSTSANPSFTVSLPDDEVNVKDHVFTVTVTEACATGAPFCSGTERTLTRTLKVVGRGHDFEFNPALRGIETNQKANPSDQTKLIVVSSEGLANSTASYKVDVVNVKASGATWEILGYAKGMHTLPTVVENPVSSISDSGFTVTTPTANTADSVVLKFDGAIAPNTTFAIKLQASNPDAAPQYKRTTDITLGFIFQESVKPSVIASAFFDAATNAAYVWPDGSLNPLVFPADADAKIVARFSEAVTGAKVSYLGGKSAGMPQVMNGTGTDWSYAVTSGELKSILGEEIVKTIEVVFSGASDTQNDVVKNQMEDVLAEFTIVSTPRVESVKGVGLVAGETVMERNGWISVAFSQELTNDLAQIKAAIDAPNLNFYLDYGNDPKSVLLMPFPFQDVVKNGDSATVTIHKGKLFNSAGYSNLSTQTFTLNFKPDVDAPYVISEDFESNDDFTAVTMTLVFNEALDSAKTSAYVTNITDSTGGANGRIDFTKTVLPDGKTLVLEVIGLLADKEYLPVITVSDGSITDVVEGFSFFTLDVNDPKIIAEVAAIKAEEQSDNTSPEILTIVPDLDDPYYQVNVPSYPLITIEFSERMKDSVTASVMLSTASGANGQNGVAMVKQTFDGYTLTLLPASRLKEGQKYYISFDLAKALDATKGNPLIQKEFSFTTYKSPVPGQKDTNSAPEFYGSNLTDGMSVEDSIRLYFDEQISIDSLSSAVSFTPALTGAWVLDGIDAVYRTNQDVAGKSFSATIHTSKVADALGKKNVNGEIVKVDFSFEGDVAIRGFDVFAYGAEVKSEWSAPVAASAISTYVLKYQALDSDFTPIGSVVELGSTSGVKPLYDVTGVISGFVAGNSYVFTIEALSDSGSVVASDSVDLLSIPKAEDTTKQFISKLSKKSVAVGSVTTAGNKPGFVTIKPSALKKSINVAVAKASDTLKSQVGGGERFSSVTQFLPEGVSFKEPVEFGLAVEIPAGLSTLTSSCSTLGATCERELFNTWNLLTYDTAKKQWTASTVAKTKVKVLSATKAIVYGKTSHFSSYVVARSLSISAPANDSKLTTASIGQTDYLTYVSLTGDYVANNISVVFSPSTYGFAYGPDANDTKRIRIYNNAVTRPSGDNSTSVTVTVRVTDSASNTTDTRVYTIPLLDSTGNKDYTGTPKSVDWFKAYRSNTTVDLLTWSIVSDATTRTIDQVVIVSKDLTSKSAAVTTTYARSVTSATMTVVSTHAYEYTIYTRSYLGKLSLATENIVRYTQYGVLTNRTSDGSVAGVSVGTSTVTLNFSGIGAGEDVQYRGYSDADRLANAGSGKMLLTTNTLYAQGYGTVEFLSDTFFDFSFNGSEASVAYTINKTGSYIVYHYTYNTSGQGYWEKLPTTQGTSKLWATVVNNGNGTSTITITSLGAGSPFVVGPNISAPAVVRSGGGGGCSIGDEQSSMNGLLNLLLVLMPVLLIFVRRR